MALRGLRCGSQLRFAMKRMDFKLEKSFEAASHDPPWPISCPTRTTPAIHIKVYTQSISNPETRCHILISTTCGAWKAAR